MMKITLLRKLRSEIFRFFSQPKKVASYLMILAVLCCLYYFIGCPIYFVFGVPCPGCGMTRACFAVLHGQIMQAFYWHPLWPVLPPFLALLALKRGRACKTKRRNIGAYTTVFVLTIGIYVLRMLFLFPHSAPMAYNGNSVVNKIIEILGGVLA